MIGLALAAKRLALRRSNWWSSRVSTPNPYEPEWELCSRMHGDNFPKGPTGHYYRIIDNITAGRAP